SGDYYFNSYAHIEIHDQMLKDRVRTEAYRDFMYDNKHFFDGKIVLDVGCGTGILSMFAAKSGAARVFAVDNSNIIEQAKKIAKENGLDDRITFIRGKVEEIKLPVPTVDIIISEWMGYFLLFEAMLDSVLVARDKFLAPDGILAPNRSSIHLIGIEDEGLMNDKIDFWSDVYGFKMQTVQRTVYNEAIVDTVNAETRITDSCCLQSFDHNVVAAAQLDFKTKFTLRASKDATLHAFLGYFDIDFETTADDTDARPVMFTTGPHGIETHWKQTIFVLKESLSVKEGDIITGVFTCQKSTENQRELDLDISYWKVDENGTALTESRSQSFQLR
ncbi:S-adenosyl-L-methionine-dependent methyltransferase, partial [Thamnocephalis sphaerospora]